MHLHIRSAVGVLLALVLAGCTAGDEDVSPTPPPPVTPTGEPVASVSPTPPALPDEPPATRGPVAADCVNGWKTPAEDSARFAEPLELIRRQMGVDGELVVVDMRSFAGPESPPSDKGYLAEVERWYVKAFAQDDLSFQGRFLVESRTFGSGSSRWRRTTRTASARRIGSGSSSTAAIRSRSSTRVCPACGRGSRTTSSWAAGGLEIPGLPDEVAGCLDAT